MLGAGAHSGGVIDAQLLDLAARQYGVVSADQARSLLGISRQSIARARRKGTLVELCPGILRIASSPVTFDMQCMALDLRFDDLHVSLN